MERGWSVTTFRNLRSTRSGHFRARELHVPAVCVGHAYRSDETALLGVERIHGEFGFKTKFQAAQNILETLSLLSCY